MDFQHYFRFRPIYEINLFFAQVMLFNVPPYFVRYLKEIATDWNCIVYNWSITFMIRATVFLFLLI